MYAVPIASSQASGQRKIAGRVRERANTHSIAPLNITRASAYGTCIRTLKQRARPRMLKRGVRRQLGVCACEPNGSREVTPMSARMYGLFEKQTTITGKPKWVRVHASVALPKPQAVRIFQNQLLSPLFGGNKLYEIRLVPKAEQQHYNYANATR